MFHQRNSLGGRKVSPPQPTCFSAEQKCTFSFPRPSYSVTPEMPPRSPPFKSKHSHNFSATYLDNLRNNRPSRPTGSRPAPFSPGKHGSWTSQSTLTRSDSAPTVTSHKDGPLNEDTPFEDAHPTVQKSMSFSSTTSPLKGRPLAQPPGGDRPILRGRKVSPTATVQLPQPSADGAYVESTTRKLEKEEAHDLREALELIDQRDEERIYKAAQDEAADLVWKHRNPRAAEEEKVAPYVNPDLKSSDKRRNSGHRRVTSSRKSSFPTTGSKIYEEPEQKEDLAEKPSQPTSQDLPLRAKSRNSLPWLRKTNPEKTEPASVPAVKIFDRFEIHKNPPTQSRNADYTANTPPRPPAIDVIEEVDTPNSTGTLEIRSDEIRAATSMKRKDRSPNLPKPTAVSDQFGRPIVSFDPAWKPPGDSPRTSQDIDSPIIKLAESPTTLSFNERPLPRPTPPRPEMTLSAPAVPTIHLPDETPPSRPAPSVPELTVSAPAVLTINYPADGPAIPVINVQGDAASAVPTINLTSEPSQPSRPLPHHSSTAPPQPSSVVKTPSTRLPWLSSRNSMPTVSCSNCALPISGRIVTAGGSSTSNLRARFHPECFTCHHCSTPLECVSFYPEPDSSRLTRLESLGLDPADPSSSCNDPLRFFCHLDFHEFFSPRCRSCKTPIEGEVIVACGGEWHVGHFFCAECGDPFNSDIPFIEGSDGYAYCVGCHTKRTSARCRACKLPILDHLTVEALGGKYHEQCFACYECGSGFGVEGRFFVRDVHVRPTEKELRKGINRKVEEKAVCEACEERRLKA